VVEALVRADRAGEVPGVDRGVEDAHRQQFASSPVASHVVCDAFERAAFPKTGEDIIGGREKRRQRVVTKMIDRARCLHLLGRCASQQQPITDVGADDVIHQSAHIPLRARCRPLPIAGSDYSQPPGELLIGHLEQAKRIRWHDHTGIVAPGTSTDQAAHHSHASTPAGFTRTADPDSALRITYRTPMNNDDGNAMGLYDALIQASKVRMADVLLPPARFTPGVYLYDGSSSSVVARSERSGRPNVVGLRGDPGLDRQAPTA